MKSKKLRRLRRTDLLLLPLVNHFIGSIFRSQVKPQSSSLLVERIPSAISYTNGIGQLPVQSAAWWDSCSAKYIPILAKEGIKHNVGGDRMHGGLLVGDPKVTLNWNTLEALVNIGRPGNPIPF